MNDIVARRIKKLRLSRNMTQEDLAERLHVTRQAVSNWEMGKTAVSVDCLVRLSELYGISVDELLYGEKETVEHEYRKYQRRYVVCALVCAAVVLIALVLEATLRPILEYLLATTYNGVYYLLYKYTVDVIAAAAVGGLIPSLISLKKDIRLYGAVRRIILLLGIICLLLWFVVCIGSMFGIVKAMVFVKLASWIGAAHYVLPFLFGAGMFFGSNR